MSNLNDKTEQEVMNEMVHDGWNHLYTFQQSLNLYLGETDLYKYSVEQALSLIIYGEAWDNETSAQKMLRDFYDPSLWKNLYTVQQWMALIVTFLPQDNLIFDSSKDEMTVLYPVVDELTHEWDGTTYTETDNNTAYNNYIKALSGGDTVTFSKNKINADVNFYIWDGEIGKFLETTTDGNGDLIFNLVEDEAISNISVDGEKLEALLNKCTYSNSIQLFVPSEKVETFPATTPLTFVETSTDVYGLTIADYLHNVGTIPPNAQITFAEIVDNDVFNKENTDFYKTTYSMVYSGYFAGEKRRFTVEELMNPEFLASLMVGWFIFTQNSGNGLKRIVAYSSITYENSLKVLRALKDTATDSKVYDSYFNQNSIKFSDSADIRKAGEKVRTLPSIANIFPLSQTDNTKQPTLLANGAMAFGTASTAVAWLDSGALINWGTKYRIVFEGVKFYSLSTTNYLMGNGTSNFIAIGTTGSIALRFGSTTSFSFSAGLLADTEYKIDVYRRLVGATDTISVYVNDVQIGADTEGNGLDFVSRFVGTYTNLTAGLKGEIKSRKILKL